MFENNRILIVDDNPAIHEDISKALNLSSQKMNENFDSLEKEIFGDLNSPKTKQPSFIINHAFSTNEAFSKIELAQRENNPYALVFMDIKMPPGMDGLKASQIILTKYPHLEIVLCTAFTEYTHHEILESIGLTDHILFLKKPFDVIEVRQIATALIQKWNLNQKVILNTQLLEEKVHQRTIELEGALVKIKNADQAKSNFLSLMSHEIRNPINSIIGLLGLIKSSKDDGDKNNYMGMTVKAANTLHSLVNDILDLSKIEANKLIIEDEEFDLLDVVEEVLTTFSIPIYQKGIELSALIPISIPKKLKGDSQRIKQILINFLTNASKFTSKGSIIIGLNIIADLENFLQLQISVTDTGIGISKEDQQSLFTDYTQVHESSPYNIIGTGLGLSITKKLAELMGGSVGVRSKKNKGSSFYFDIQLSKVNKKQDRQFDLSQISHKTGVLVYTNSSASKNFFKFYANEFNLNNKFILTDNIDHSLAKKLKDINDLETLHFYFDTIDQPMSQMIQKVEKKLSITIISHPLTSLLFNSDMPDLPFKKIPIPNPITPSCFFKSLTSQDTKLFTNKESQQDLPFSEEELSSRKKKCRILVVDDDPLALLTTSTNLINFGFNVDQAESSEIAIRYHKKNNYDLIFMDIMLNGTNGIETTQEIRALPSPHNNPHIIALTANSFVEDKRRCLAGGMNQFLSKPITVKKLNETALEFIAEKFAFESKVDFTSPLENISFKNIIEKKIKQFFIDKYHFNERQSTDILKTTQTSLQEAFEKITEYLVTKDKKNLIIYFHRLKGSFKNIGLEDYAKDARKVEIGFKDKPNYELAEETLNNFKSSFADFIKTPID
ncbi:MAG: hypothetical protein COA79_00760 [Planctomycetota bacterium]|nr:MAG: hypothetical protein COA79_00760 [Planctomycetota bacterium]